MTTFEEFARNVTKKFNNHFDGNEPLTFSRETQLLLIAAAEMFLRDIAAPGFAFQILENLAHADVMQSPEVCASAALSWANL
jgi:hypothetical protein